MHIDSVHHNPNPTWGRARYECAGFEWWWWGGALCRMDGAEMAMLTVMSVPTAAPNAITLYTVP